MSYVEDVLNALNNFGSYYNTYKSTGTVMTRLFGIITYNIGHLLVKYVTNDMLTWKISIGSITKKLIQSLLLHLLICANSSEFSLELFYLSFELFNLVCKITGRKNIY